MKIAELLLQTLEANGVRHIFGNPGTTEIPLVRLCERRRRLKYVVALSEVSAVPMADGYARATRSLGVVNLHVAPGLGNGMGGLYTAGIAQTPLLVLIGGQDRRFLHTRPILWGPLEKMAGSVCKAVFGLNTRHDAAFNIRRALRVALTPPYGPVALICPPDLLEQELDARPVRVTLPALGALTAAEARRYAHVLAQARRPALIAAEDVHWNDAGAALEEILEHEIARPAGIRRKADHGDGLHGVENAANIGVGIGVVIHVAPCASCARNAAFSASSSAIFICILSNAPSISVSVKRVTICCEQFTSQASIVNKMARSGLAL